MYKFSHIFISTYNSLIYSLTQSTIFILFRGPSKSDALDCYLRAANLFKMSKKWAQAGQAFCNAAQLHLKAGIKHDAATNFVDASTCFKKCDANGKWYIITFWSKLTSDQTLVVINFKIYHSGNDLIIAVVWQLFPWDSEYVCVSTSLFDSVSV